MSPACLHRAVAASLLAAFLVAGCSTERKTAPSRTATEQLLLSAAADRAVQDLVLDIPHGTKVFVDAGNFEGIDSKYAIGALRDRLLRRGARMAARREDADAIVEIRSGALSIDENSLVVGIPQFDMPIPATGAFAFPEIALFKRDRRQGVAKFAATSYDAKTGELISTTAPHFGFSENTEWGALLFLSWTTSDVLPDGGTRLPPPPPDTARPD